LAALVEERWTAKEITGKKVISKGIKMAKEHMEKYPKNIQILCSKAIKTIYLLKNPVNLVPDGMMGLQTVWQKFLEEWFMKKALRRNIFQIYTK
jgi:hypothetical protein